MTTRVTIRNETDSNRAQHVEVTLIGGGASGGIKLAPGEDWTSPWITDTHTIVVREVNYAKPVQP